MLISADIIGEVEMKCNYHLCISIGISATISCA